MINYKKILENIRKYKAKKAVRKNEFKSKKVMYRADYYLLYMTPLSE